MDYSSHPNGMLSESFRQMPTLVTRCIEFSVLGSSDNYFTALLFINYPQPFVSPRSVRLHIPKSHHGRYLPE